MNEDYLNDLPGAWVSCSNCKKKGIGPIRECREEINHNIRCGFYE